MNEKKDLYALGVGATTPVFCELAEDCGFNIAGLYHYESGRTGENVCGKKIIGSFEDMFNSDISGKSFLLTMGDMKIRKELSERIACAGGILPTIIHPKAKISSYAEISNEGVIVGPLVVVQAGVIIDKGVLLRDMALVCHNARIEKYTFVGPKALIGAFSHIKENAFIGQAVTLVSKKAKIIGQNSLIGAGALVVNDIPDNVVAFGNPAKVKNSTELQ